MAIPKSVDVQSFIGRLFLKGALFMILIVLAFILALLYHNSLIRSPQSAVLLIFVRQKQQKTYNSGDSLVVTDPTTNPPVSGLTMGERTGSRIFHYLWSYVLVELQSLAIPYYLHRSI